MIHLYEDLQARHPQAVRISVIIDNARYNRSRELRAYLEKPGCCIVPVNLPSNAPTLNLIDRFWHFMKRKVLFNRAYARFALFEHAFQDFFQRLDHHTAELRSILSDRFHYIGSSKNGTSAT